MAKPQADDIVDAVRRNGLVAIAAVIASATICRAASPPFPLATDPRIDSSRFRVTTFASGLPYTTGMQQLSDGSLLVAINDPTGGKYYASTGRLLRLTDTNHDGVADDAGTLLNA